MRFLLMVSMAIGSTLSSGCRNQDLDRDQYGMADCDDQDPDVHPGADDDVGNGVDENCDGADGVDQDGDGWASSSSGGTDCNDLDNAVSPGETEYCDGIDNDCDGDTDEDDALDATNWYADTDQDSYGDPLSITVACEQPPGFVEDNTDCMDTNASVNPGATEVCDAVDNDCDGVTDEQDAMDASAWYIDYDGDGYGSDSYIETACDQPTGYVADVTDCDDTDPTVNPSGTEVCDGIDNDCDGVTDEGDAPGAVTWYADMDEDSYGDPLVSNIACMQPSGYVSDNTDCDDSNPGVNPDAADICSDGIDSDCDGDMSICSQSLGEALPRQDPVVLDAGSGRQRGQSGGFGRGIPVEHLPHDPV